MSSNETQEQVRAELETRWRERQEAYRRALQAWRNYPAPSEDDPTAEARDRDGKLKGGQG